MSVQAHDITKCWHCGVDYDLFKKTGPGAYILGVILEV